MNVIFKKLNCCGTVVVRIIAVADLCTLRILPYLVRNSTQNTEIRICYFGYGNAHLLNTETLMVT